MIAPVSELAPSMRSRGLRLSERGIQNGSVPARDTIHRPFFLAGIAVILTVGAAWGVYLLWKIGFAGTFTGVSIHEVNAHGYAQISGWVGLFIMGFAYQVFPRLWNAELVRPRLAILNFGVMAAAITLGTVGLAGAGTSSAALPMAMTGVVLQVVVAVLFAGQLGATFRRGNVRLEPWIGFVFLAVLWFVVQAVGVAAHTWNTMTATSREDLLWHIATYQAPLRDVQIHGMALFMILGVCMRMLPVWYIVPRTPSRRGWWALGILTAAVIGQCGLFVAYRWFNNHTLAAGLMIPWVMLVVGTAMVAVPWKLWRPLRSRHGEADRAAKFIRAGYGWLAVSLIMLLFLPVYQVVSGIPFSHAYYGAIRHAITVGFISLMIMGVAAKIVPMIRGIHPCELPSLMGPFLLVNLGCFLRVTLQTLTDWSGQSFSWVGISGVLEVIGLAWWGGHMLVLMIAFRSPTHDVPCGHDARDPSSA